MKLTVDGVDYDVKFFHTQIYYKRRPFNGWTKCEIPKLLTDGESICAKEDSFNKATGRKFALTRALNTTMVKGGEDVPRFSREFRTKFWKAYWNVIYAEKPPTIDELKVRIRELENKLEQAKV